MRKAPRNRNPIVAIHHAQSVLNELSEALLNPSPDLSAAYAVEIAKQFQAASYTLFNIANARACGEAARNAMHQLEIERGTISETPLTRGW